MTEQTEPLSAARLADNTRLRAEVAAWRGIGRLIADQDSAQDIDDPEWLQCLACGGGGPTGDSIEHHAICYVVKARALLAQLAGEQAAQSERACELCNGTGVYTQPVIFEDEHDRQAAEIARLRAALAARDGIVRAVAEAKTGYAEMYLLVPSGATALREQARALLAADGGQE